MGWKELRTRDLFYFCLQAETRPILSPDLQVEPQLLPLSFDYSCIIMTMPQRMQSLKSARVDDFTWGLLIAELKGVSCVFCCSWAGIKSSGTAAVSRPAWGWKICFQDGAFKRLLAQNLGLLLCVLPKCPRFMAAGFLQSRWSKNKKTRRNCNGLISEVAHIAGAILHSSEASSGAQHVIKGGQLDPLRLESIKVGTKRIDTSYTFSTMPWQHRVCSVMLWELSTLTEQLQKRHGK